MNFKEDMKLAYASYCLAILWVLTWKALLFVAPHDKWSRRPWGETAEYGFWLLAIIQIGLIVHIAISRPMRHQKASIFLAIVGLGGLLAIRMGFAKELSFGLLYQIRGVVVNRRYLGGIALVLLCFIYLNIRFPASTLGLIVTFLVCGILALKLQLNLLW